MNHERYQSEDYHTCCEIVAALMKSPRTKDDLREMVGVNDSVIDLWLSRLKRSGLVYIAEKRKLTPGQGRKTHVFAWQTMPFDKEDVQ